MAVSYGMSIDVGTKAGVPKKDRGRTNEHQDHLTHGKIPGTGSNQPRCYRCLNVSSEGHAITIARIPASGM